jgi:HlyD family secretion protein
MKRPSRRVVVAAAGTVAALALLALLLPRGPGDSGYQTAVADRGDVVDVVGATGTLEAVTTVQVGSQVSGTIATLHADFNSTVRRGQVVARLDPSLFEARVSQARANLTAARANVERARATAEDARQKLVRARELAAKELLPASDLETAQANHDAALAQLKANEAAVSQAEANLNQADVDLGHTIITAPIDGVVIGRNVDVGQTVAASFQAPVLFVIANDLRRMQVNAAIDEADIGRVQKGQEVSFRVDAYPERTFAGRVEQVRLQPTVAQNVVTYNTIISVDNPEQTLMPGMTATVSVIVRQAEDVVRVPAAALRFRPEGFEGTGRGRGRTGASAAGGPPAGSGVAAAATPTGQGRPGAGRGGGEGRRVLVFLLDEKGSPVPTPVVPGLSDGQFLEIKEGLGEGARVVVGAGMGRPMGRPGASPSTNPFSPQFQRRQR